MIIYGNQKRECLIVNVQNNIISEDSYGPIFLPKGLTNFQQNALHTLLTRKIIQNDLESWVPLPFRQSQNHRIKSLRYETLL